MIDLEKAKFEFDNYAKRYDMKDETINRKYYHTYRVMEIAGEIAKSLKLSEEEIKLAKLIGLLHDIARFEQYTQFHTFSDLRSFDHGDYGIEILKKDNFIRRFVKTDEYDNIIFKAVKNHNKFQIEKGLLEKELLFSKIVRDADKLDIYYEILTMFYKDPEEIEDLENTVINEDSMKQILKYETLKRRKNENPIDRFIIILYLTFDLNYKYSFEIIYKEDYINKIINRFDFKKQDTRKIIEKVREVLNNYIQTKKG